MIVKDKIRKKRNKDKLHINYQKSEISKVNRFFTFRIADEVYGINICDITEIIEIQKINNESNMPDFVKGVITLKEKIVPIIDLRLRFNLKEREYDDRTSIIIVKINEFEIGFIVDTILEVVNIANTDITPVSKLKVINRYKKRFIFGIGWIGEDAKVLLDIKKIVRRDDLMKINQK